MKDNKVTPVIAHAFREALYSYCEEACGKATADGQLAHVSPTAFGPVFIVHLAEEDVRYSLYTSVLDVDGELSIKIQSSKSEGSGLLQKCEPSEVPYIGKLL